MHLMWEVTDKYNSMRSLAHKLLEELETKVFYM